MTRMFTNLLVLALVVLAVPALADGTYQTLPFAQDWSNIGMITVDDSWTGVPGILGYRGDNITSAVGVDPQTLLAIDAGLVLDINANKTDPLAFFSGGATEFELTDPVVALAGSGTADAPYLQLHLNTTGLITIVVSYDLLDLELGADNAIQQVALHYRTSTANAWTNVPAAYVADASDGPALLKTTPVSVTLPVDTENAATLELRIMTTNALGNDEWIGIDNITVTGTQPVANEDASWGQIKTLFR